MGQQPIIKCTVSQLEEEKKRKKGSKPCNCSLYKRIEGSLCCVWRNIHIPRIRGGAVDVSLVVVFLSVWVLGVVPSVRGTLTAVVKMSVPPMERRILNTSGVF